jgi:hypothetical protein
MSKMRDFLMDLAGILLGVLAAVLILAFALGMQISRHEPGLWTMRAQRVVNCGLDYNGPPFTAPGSVTLWLTCGSDDQGWRLWPPGQD